VDLPIIKATEAIPVDHPIFMLFGRPALGKTSLGYSAPRPLLLDFDGGAHRAVNRRDTLQVPSWQVVEQLIASPDVLTDYDTLVVDTVGRCLDLLTLDIARTDPKKAPGGTLSLQGYGVLRTRFRQFITAIRGTGKDVLLLAHDKEDKDGDAVMVRPDIVGASLGEVMRIADFVGYLHMVGRDRMVDFNPTDRWTGKNPAQWRPFTVPAPAQAASFMADLMAKGRDALGAISAESAKVVEQVEHFRDLCAMADTPEAVTSLIATANAAPPLVQPQAKRILKDRADALGFTFDQAAKKFTAPAGAAA
jgi:hypothetical protein